MACLFCGSLMANDLPNPCSRDRNFNEFTIFSYHEIAEKSETLDSTYAVSAANFEAQMKWLIDEGYHFIKIDDIINARKHNTPLPSNGERYAHVTPDDLAHAASRINAVFSGYDLV